MNVKSPLLEASAVHDRKNVPVWVALALSAGAVNATAMLACQRFVSHVTGSLTRLGADYASLRLLVEYAAVLISFVLGAMTSFWLLDGRRLRGKSPLVAAPLLLVMTTLVGVAVAGRLGAFGAFGRTLETTGDFVMLALLAFAMGLQNASVATTSGMIVRTTHMTGPLTDLSIALAAYTSKSTPANVRETARRSFLLRAIKIGSFCSGAFIAAVFSPRLDYFTFLIPAAISGVAAVKLSGIVLGQNLQRAEVPASA